MPGPGPSELQEEMLLLRAVSGSPTRADAEEHTLQPGPDFGSSAPPLGSCRGAWYSAGHREQKSG